MGPKPVAGLRVVFDTNTVLSALLFSHGKLSWLRGQWRTQGVTTLASKQTVQELLRVLAYPKFRLAKSEAEELLSDYLPYTEIITIKSRIFTEPRCRDQADQIFIDLAVTGKADVLVTGDKDLLDLSRETTFGIETPAQYKCQFVK